MYYKIENKDSEVYKSLHALRTKELKMSDENLSAIKEKTGLDFESFLGHSGQQNFKRTTQYHGFKFIETEKVCQKTWQNHKEYDDMFVPNKKTKSGREMSEFLLNGLKGSNYNQVFDLLDLEHSNRFTFPYLEIVGEVIVLYLKNEEPINDNVIEITKKEFDALLSLA